jgi:hypothetical protein
MLPRSISIVVVLALAGCTAAGGFFSSTSGQRPAARGAAEGQSLALYLQFMSELVAGDAVTQAEVFQRISREAAEAPTTTNRLKLALALATPGHPSSNAEHAQRELRELLAAEELLLPEERMLVLLELEEVEQRLILDLEAQRVQEDAAETLAQQSVDSARRIQELESENRDLQQQLQDARKALDEITNIERSIRERQSDTN